MRIYIRYSYTYSWTERSSIISQVSLRLIHPIQWKRLPIRQDQEFTNSPRKLHTTFYEYTQKKIRKRMTWSVLSTILFAFQHPLNEKWSTRDTLPYVSFISINFPLQPFATVETPWRLSARTLRGMRCCTPCSARRHRPWRALFADPWPSRTIGVTVRARIRRATSTPARTTAGSSSSIRPARTYPPRRAQVRYALLHVLG